MHHALRTLGHPYAGDPSLFQYEPEVNPKLQQVAGQGLECHSTPRQQSAPCGDHALLML